MQLFLLHQTSSTHGILQAEEARHCLKVLRHKAGDIIDAVDGAGHYYRARIEETGRNEVQLSILETHKNWGEHPYRIHLWISPLRLRDRTEWLIEKAVELGVNEIHLVRCRHTVPHPPIKIERLRKIMLTAVKQCKRSRIPALHELKPLLPAIHAIPQGLLLIAQAGAASTLMELSANWPNQQEIHLLIGPEGDFSTEEMEATQHHGFQAIHLGQQRLRAETAAIHGLSLIKGLMGY